MAVIWAPICRMSLLVDNIKFFLPSFTGISILITTPFNSNIWLGTPYDRQLALERRSQVCLFIAENFRMTCYPTDSNFIVSTQLLHTDLCYLQINVIKAEYQNGTAQLRQVFTPSIICSSNNSGMGFSLVHFMLILKLICLV